MSGYTGATGLTEYELRFQEIEDSIYIDKNDISKLYILSSNLSNNLTSNLFIGDTSITSNIIKIKSYLYNGDTSITSNIIYIKNELQNETQIIPTKTAIYRVKDLEDRFTQIANGYNSGNLIDPETGQIISNTISAAFSAIGASIANIGNVAAIWYFLGQCAIAAQVGQTRAETANTKADRSLNIWEDSGNNIYHKKSGNVGIGTGFGSTLNNRLEVNGNINITNGNKYKINGFNLAYSNLDGFLPNDLTSNFITHPILNSCNYIKTLPIATTASLGIIQVGTGLSITPQGVLSANPATSVPIATTTTTGIIQVGTGLSITAQGLLSVPIATNGILGGVKPDVDTIIVNPSTGLISLSGSDIFLNGTANRAYGWTSSTSALGRVAVANSYSTGSIINDVVLRSAGNLILQSGITNPALVINTTNQVLFRNAVGIGTATISTGNILDVEGILKIATGSGTERLTITSTGVQVNHTLNVSTGLNAGGLIRLGGFADDASLDLAIIQNREYATNKGELLLFRGDNIAGTTGADRIRLRAGAIAFDVYPATSTSATTENIRMYLDGNGNVGIGITTPNNTLHLHKTATLQKVSITLTDGTTTSAVNRGLQIIKGDDGNGSLYNFENKDLIFGTNAVDRMRISAIGAVGIQNAGYAIPNNNMSAGSLAIGNITANYGGGTASWNANTAGLMMECLDNTEIAVHDSGASIHSLMYYSTNGNITIGRNMGHGVANVSTAGNLSVGGTSFLRNTYIYSGNEGTSIALYFGTPFTGSPTGASKSAIIAEAITSYSRHNLSLCLNTATDNSINASANDRFITLNSGGFIQMYRSVKFSTDVWNTTSDGGSRLYFGNGSTTYIGGYGSTAIEFRVNDGTLLGRISSSGQIGFHFLSVSNSGTDYVGVQANTALNSLGFYYLHIMYASFTGYHRCYYKDDEIFNNDMTNEEVDIFKNNYKGRIVISTGKIKTDFSRALPKDEEPDNGNRPSNYEEIKNANENIEWYSLIDKDGITIEESIPVVQLCKVRKDKRVYGVLGNAERKTNNKNRLIVNSIGEGAICVCNTNGNIENGDYIQSSELLGYGEKQDDDILHNYSVAKAVMDCNFELDSPYYQCYELEGGVRVAFIACTYHAG